MKKIAIPALAALIACPAMAGQNYQESFFENINPYISLKVGGGFNNLNYDFNDKKESLTDETLHGRAALGLAMWCNRARTEVEWSMFTKMKDTNNFKDITDVNVETKLQTLLLNAYMDIGDYKMIRPFIGFGGGMAFADVKRKVPNVGHDSNDQTKFSAMGTLGMTFDWNVFAVDMAFRYTYADINSGLHNFAGDIGVRYMF